MKAREKMIGRRSCPKCGGTTEKFSVHRQTDLICSKCGTVLSRVKELPPTYTQVVGRCR